MHFYYSANWASGEADCDPSALAMARSDRRRDKLAEYPDPEVAKDPQRSGTQKLTGGWPAFTSVTQLLF
jgi:hypothetical protein